MEHFWYSYGPTTLGRPPLDSLIAQPVLIIGKKPPKLSASLYVPVVWPPHTRRAARVALHICEEGDVELTPARCAAVERC
jgi:hypothetical protein